MPARQVVFRGWRCRIDRGTYGATQRIALQLTDCADGEPVAVATVHMPDPRCATNADMGPEAIRTHCTLDGAGHSLMKAAVRQLDLSAGAYQRILRIARTIADLARAEQIGAAHLAESVQYRARPTL
jgi:hypothetical protein